MNTPPPRWATAVLLAVAVGMIALAPGQLALRKLVGEPYPRVMMPSFGTVEAAKTGVSTRTLSLEGVRADGSTMHLDILRLLPQSETLPMILANIGFEDREKGQDPATAAWLRERVTSVYTDERFVAVDIDWTAETVELPSGHRSAALDRAASYTIVLPEATR